MGLIQNQQPMVGRRKTKQNDRKKTVSMSSRCHAERVLCSTETKDFRPRCAVPVSAKGVVSGQKRFKYEIRWQELLI